MTLEQPRTDASDQPLPCAPATSGAAASPARPHILLRSPPAVTMLVIISLAFNWFYLTGGFYGEDHAFINILRQEPLPFSRLAGLWSTMDFPALNNLWWFEGKAVTPFWRPVPSLIFEGSLHLFGDHAFPLHLFSILVHGLVAGTLFLLVRGITGRPLLAFLSGLFFLSCEDHSMVVGWIATFTDPVCAFFVNIALLAHAAWLRRRRPWMLVASLAALVPALLSKESAVVAPLAIALMTLLMPRGRGTEPSDFCAPWLRARFTGFLRDRLSWLPAIALLAVYLTTYTLVGFGSFSSGMYINPVAEPVRYLIHLLWHLPVMWLGTLSPIPPSLAPFFPQTIPVLAIAGAVAAAVCTAGLWPVRTSPLIMWAAGMYLLALLPQMAADASERGLYLPSIGASILLAQLFMQIGPIARRVTRSVQPPPLFTRIAAWSVCVVMLLPGVVLAAAMPYVLMPGFDASNAEVETMLPYVRERNPRHVIVLNTSGPFQTMYPPGIVEHVLGRSIDVRVLSSLSGVMSVQREDDHGFILRSDRPGWLTNFFAAILRSPKPLQRHKAYEKDILTATLIELTSGGRDILGVRFRMREPLNDPATLFVYWDGQAFRPIDLAGLAAGEVVTLADTSDLWASMW